MITGSACQRPTSRATTTGSAIAASPAQSAKQGHKPVASDTSHSPTAVELEATGAPCSHANGGLPDRSAHQRPEPRVATSSRWPARASCVAKTAALLGSRRTRIRPLCLGQLLELSSARAGSTRTAQTRTSAAARCSRPRPSTASGREQRLTLIAPTRPRPRLPPGPRRRGSRRRGGRRGRRSS